MSPITHFLGSWAIADATKLAHRDRSLIVWCGLLPDLDGAGVLMDLVNHLLGYPDVFWYVRFHHFVLHGLPGALALALIAACLAARQMHVFLWSFAIVHLHLLCDLVGSRGPIPDDIWPIRYLGPLSRKALVLGWEDQWRLDAWPNVVATILLIVYALYRTVDAGRSPVSMFSEKAHDAVAEALRSQWNLMRDK